MDASRPSRGTDADVADTRDSGDLPRLRSSGPSNLSLAQQEETRRLASSGRSLTHTASAVSLSSFSVDDGTDCAAETYAVGEYHLSACPICLEHFTLDNPAIIVRCEHGFHLQCLESWRMRSNECPVCLRPLEPEAERLMGAADARRRRRHRLTAAATSLRLVPAPACTTTADSGVDEDAPRRARHHWKQGSPVTDGLLSNAEQQLGEGNSRDAGGPAEGEDDDDAESNSWLCGSAWCCLLSVCRRT